MKVPGVEVQPLVKMTGETGFNEVLFEDVVIPRDSLLDEEGKGKVTRMSSRGFAHGDLAADPAYFMTLISSSCSATIA